jgi:hypothetical protein
VLDLTLKVLGKDRFTLLDSANKPIAGEIDLVHLLAEFGKLTEAGKDPFVTIDIAGNLTLQQMHEFFSLIQTLDRETGIRVEAPPPGQLYYRAFFPEPEWRDRTKRLGRPWELHTKVGNANGSLLRHPHPPRRRHRQQRRQRRSQIHHQFPRRTGRHPQR